MVLQGKLKQVQVEAYKDEYPILLDKGYAELITDKECYPALIKLT